MKESRGRLTPFSILIMNGKEVNAYYGIHIILNDFVIDNCFDKKVGRPLAQKIAAY